MSVKMRPVLRNDHDVREYDVTFLQLFWNITVVTLFVYNPNIEGTVAIVSLNGHWAKKRKKIQVGYIYKTKVWMLAHRSFGAMVVKVKPDFLILDQC